MPLMMPARKQRLDLRRVAESAKMRGALAAGCFSALPALSGLTTGMRVLRANVAAADVGGVNIR